MKKQVQKSLVKIKAVTQASFVNYLNLKNCDKFPGKRLRQNSVCNTVVTQSTFLRVYISNKDLSQNSYSVEHP